METKQVNLAVRGDEPSVGNPAEVCEVNRDALPLAKAIQFHSLLVGNVVRAKTAHNGQQQLLDI